VSGAGGGTSRPRSVGPPGAGRVSGRGRRAGRTGLGRIQQVVLDADVHVDCGSCPVLAW
jgi:hypothetical protein